MKDLKNILRLICFCLYALAVIGGFGYCGYIHKWLFAIAILALGAMAFPFVKKLWPTVENSPFNEKKK
jgi:hypothetical protein